MKKESRINKWKFRIVKTLVYAYLITGVIFSFNHLIQAAYKAGGDGNEAIATPFLIDGFFVIGMVMRSEAFSSRARRIGLRVMIFSGVASFVGNVFAAHNLFGYIFGGSLPIFIVFSEWLSDPKQMESAEQENRREEAAEAALRATEHAAQVAANRAAGREKARATRAGATVVDQGGLDQLPPPSKTVPPPPIKRTRKPRVPKVEETTEIQAEPVTATVKMPNVPDWASQDTQMIPLVKEESSNPAPAKSKPEPLYAV